MKAPLKGTDRLRAQAGRLGQLFLGQPRLDPQLPQQPSETQLRLRHRPASPRDRPPQLPGTAREPILPQHYAGQVTPAIPPACPGAAR